MLGHPGDLEQCLEHKVFNKSYQLLWTLLIKNVVIQWLGFCAPATGGTGSIPDQGTRSHMPQRVPPPKKNLRMWDLHMCTQSLTSSLLQNSY